jgi:DNA-binding transcriptional regulator LsrR (DeoR family)
MNSKLAKEMVKEDFYKEAFEQIKECNIAIMGIGELSEKSTMVTEGYLSKCDRDMLCQSGYVGDICFNHYKINGEFGTVQLQNRVMGVDMERLQKMPTVIAIAGGEQKADAVFGALNTDCIDILIIDTSIAKELEKKIALIN